MKTLENHMKEILSDLESDGNFTLRAHELTHDGAGWSTNDVFTILKDGGMSQALDAARGRWEVVKANYGSKLRVQDIECVDSYDGRATIEVSCLPFLDIGFTPDPSVCLSHEEYDVEAIRSDSRNGNYSGNPEDYEWASLVIDSLVNGQFSQARRIYAEHVSCFSSIVERATGALNISARELAIKLHV